MMRSTAVLMRVLLTAAVLLVVYRHFDGCRAVMQAVQIVQGDWAGARK